MLHSFYYSATQRAFEEVAAEDNSCAIAAWGYASILMSNPLQGVGASPKSAQQAQDAISAKITNEELTKLNKLVDVDKQDPEKVANDWLTQQGLL